METKSIEERAHEHATRLVGGHYSGGFKGGMWDAAYNRYIEIATEQDRIARAEERERCIVAAHEAVIEELSDDIRVDASDVARGVENILRRKLCGRGHDLYQEINLREFLNKNE